MSREFWDDRYAADDLIYGEAPNAFVAASAARFPRQGQALDIAAGEGRNALFLASLGLDVLAIDQSGIGLAKASRLAKERGLALRTQAVDLADFRPDPASFDVITSTFVHLPPVLRRAVHAGVREWLRPAGVYVLEAYAPDQISRKTGGPTDPAVYASLETLVSELAGLHVEHQAALVRDVVEGRYHTGAASVVQVVAVKR